MRKCPCLGKQNNHVGNVIIVIMHECNLRWVKITFSVFWLLSSTTVTLGLYSIRHTGCMWSIVHFAQCHIRPSYQPGKLLVTKIFVN